MTVDGGNGLILTSNPDNKHFRLKVVAVVPTVGTLRILKDTQVADSSCAGLAVACANQWNRRRMQQQDESETLLTLSGNGTVVMRDVSSS